MDIVLTDEQKAELQKQADAFSVFLEKNVAANLLKGVNYGSFFFVVLFCCASIGWDELYCTVTTSMT